MSARQPNQAPDMNQALENLKGAMDTASATGVRDVDPRHLYGITPQGKQTYKDDVSKHGIGYTYVGESQTTLVASKAKARIHRSDFGRTYQAMTGESQGTYSGSTLSKADGKEDVRASGPATVTRHTSSGGLYQGHITGEKAARATEIISRRAASKIGHAATQRAVNIAESYTVK